MADQSLTQKLFDDGNSQKPDPFELFQDWMAQATESEINDPNAMSLATVDGTGLPDCRMVLLNQFDERGFVFFTNSNSAKGQQLAQNPVAALLFHWKSVRRQIRIRGAIAPVAPAESDAYFASRPRGSQAGAHASDQSKPLPSRAHLQQKVADMEQKFADTDVPRPDHWFGYRLTPVEIEFWQDGEFRLHDRVKFERVGGTWQGQRLNP